LSGRLFEALGLVSGLVLIDYGFNFAAVGITGARAFTSQFLGANLIVGGSAIAFASLYYMLKPATQPQQAAAVEKFAPPDIGVELVVEEATPPKSGFYRNIEYVGYFFAFLGLISAADLVLQVFIRSTYDELRWWVEVLLVTFGVLSYTIFVSIGRLGAQEEAKLTGPPVTPTLTPQHQPIQATAPQHIPAPPSESTSMITLIPTEFTRSSTGEYERHVSASTYDMFRVESDLITIWREDRKGMRSVYLTGPYELNRKLLEEHVRSGTELKIGSLTLTPDALRSFLDLEHPSAQSSAPAQAAS
jgi:hypothetical protein